MTRGPQTAGAGRGKRRTPIKRRRRRTIIHTREELLGLPQTPIKDKDLEAFTAKDIETAYQLYLTLARKRFTIDDLDKYIKRKRALREKGLEKLGPVMHVALPAPRTSKRSRRYK